MSAPEVLFIQATNPAAYPPLINAAFMLSEAGWRGTFLSSPIASEQLKLPLIPNFDLVELAPRPSYIMPKTTYLKYCRSAYSYARRLHPDIIYASDPMGALPGLIAARACGAELFYHEHDSPNRQADLNPLTRWARRSAARTARSVVFPNAERGEQASKELDFAKEKLVIVWNLPRRAEIAQGPQPSQYLSTLYYHGSITPARLPEAAAEAAAAFNGRVKLRIAGYETASGKGHVSRLERRFGRIDKGGLIEHLGTIDERSDLLQRAAQADIGLALMPPQSEDINMRCMAGASNKPFDYMAAGLAMIVSDLPDWQAMFVESGYALAADPQSPKSLQSAIRTLLDNPVATDRMRRRNLGKMQADWNYDTAFAPVLAEMQRFVASHGASADAAAAAS